jgi:hypothetical protein
MKRDREYSTAFAFILKTLWLRVAIRCLISCRVCTSETERGSRNSVFYPITITFLSLSHNISILICLYHDDTSHVFALGGILQIRGCDLQGTREQSCVKCNRFQARCVILVFKQVWLQTRTNSLLRICIKYFWCQGFFHCFHNILTSMNTIVIKLFVPSSLSVYRSGQCQRHGCVCPLWEVCSYTRRQESQESFPPLNFFEQMVVKKKKICKRTKRKLL